MMMMTMMMKSKQIIWSKLEKFLNLMLSDNKEIQIPVIVAILAMYIRLCDRH